MARAASPVWARPALVGTRADGNAQGGGFAGFSAGDDVCGRTPRARRRGGVHVHATGHAGHAGGIAHDAGGEDEAIVGNLGTVGEANRLALEVEGGHLDVQTKVDPGELRRGLRQGPGGVLLANAAAPRVLPASADGKLVLLVEDDDRVDARELRVGEGLGGAEAAEAGADDDDASHGGNARVAVTAEIRVSNATTIMPKFSGEGLCLRHSCRPLQQFHIRWRGRER